MHESSTIDVSRHGLSRSGFRLRTLDESTKVIRQNANIPSRASSVSGIGAVGRCHSSDAIGRKLKLATVEKPDYSEAKIVVAMVRSRAHLT